jgi:hypothetical protein
MAIKLKSALKIPRQQLLLVVRALVFTTSLWLLADRDFSPFQLSAFILIGAVLYFTPVFQTLLIFPSFLALMILGPIAMSVFGAQIEYPSLLAGCFGILFFIILGIKQVVFVSRVKLYHVLHLALLYGMSILFFAAPSGDWFIVRSLAFALLTTLLFREFLFIRASERGAGAKLFSAVFSLLCVEALWVISLLPIGFINAAGVLLVLIFSIEEVAVLSLKAGLNRRSLMLELITGVALIATIFIFSNWSLL